MIRPVCRAPSQQRCIGSAVALRVAAPAEVALLEIVDCACEVF
jgi:hypothetical protein